MKIVHVHLIFEKKDYYYGSFSAIFDDPIEGLTEEAVGIRKSTLLHSQLKDGSIKYTKRAKITVSHLIRNSAKNNK